MSDVLDAALAIFDCDRAWLVYPCDPEALSHSAKMQRTRLHPECLGWGRSQIIPQALVDQLAVGGIMILPLGPQDDHQSLVRLVRTDKGIERWSVIGGQPFVLMDQTPFLKTIRRCSNSSFNRNMKYTLCKNDTRSRSSSLSFSVRGMTAWAMIGP